MPDLMDDDIGQTEHVMVVLRAAAQVGEQTFISRMLTENENLS